MQWNSRRTFCAQAALEALSLACAGDPGPGGEKFGHPAGHFCRVSFLFRLMHTSGQLAARRAALVALTWPACWTPALVAKHLGVPFLGTRQPVGLEVVPASHGAHSGKHKNPLPPRAQGGHRGVTRWCPTPGWGPFPLASAPRGPLGVLVWGGSLGSLPRSRLPVGGPRLRAGGY